jgi:Holliday junction resolvasome RuvABC endonuclease subunit
MIFALDLATQTGWCAGSGEQSPELGSFKMPDTKEEIGPFLDYFFKKMNKLFDEYQPSVVVFEAPFLPRAKIDEDGHLRQAPTTVATLRKLQGLAGVLEMVCYQRTLDVYEVNLGSVKSAMGGNRGAGKPDIMAAAKRCGMDPKNYDEADAFGVWIVAMRHHAKQFQQIWDQRLYGGRAGNLAL